MAVVQRSLAMSRLKLRGTGIQNEPEVTGGGPDILARGRCALAVDAAWSLASRAAAAAGSALGTRLTSTALGAVGIADSIVEVVAVGTPLSERVADQGPPHRARSADGRSC